MIAAWLPQRYYKDIQNISIGRDNGLFTTYAVIGCREDRHDVLFVRPVEAFHDELKAQIKAHKLRRSIMKCTEDLPDALSQPDSSRCYG
jgi:hypothetical protein